MAQELTFNISEDRRKLQGPVEAKNFNLKFGTDGVAITHGNPKQWVQGRIGDKELKQVFVNITEGENNTPKDVAGLFLAFVGIIHDKDGRPHRVVDYKHSTTIDVEHGRFRFDFPDQAFTVAGEYQQAFFMLVKEGPGGGCVATMEFDMQVMANFVFTDLVPEDYITPFNDTVDQLLAACKKFKDDTAADEAKFKQELEDAYAKFQKDTNTQLNNFKDATDEDLANFKKANADDIAKFKQQYADAVQAKEDELQSKVDSYTDKIDTMLKDLNQQGIDTTTMLNDLRSQIAELQDKIKNEHLFTEDEAKELETRLNKNISKIIGDLSTYNEPGTTFIEKIINEADDRGINVRHFGATGDGKTDDTEAFQKAIDFALNHNHSAVDVPAGNYVISKSLTINLISLHGDGLTATTIIPKGIDNLFFMQWKAILHDICIDNSQNGQSINDICLAPYSAEVGTNCVVNNILINGAKGYDVTALLVAPKKGNAVDREVFSFPNIVSNLTLNNVTNGIKLLTSDNGWINGNVFRDINIQGFTNTGLWITAGENPSSISHNHFSNIQVQYSSISNKDSRAFKINFGDNNRFDFITTWQDQSGDDPIPSLELKPAEGHSASEINGNVFSGVFESAMDVDPVSVRFNDFSGINLSDWKKLKFNNQLQWYSGKLIDTNFNILPSSLVSDYVNGLRSPIQLEGYCQITKVGMDQGGDYIQLEPGSVTGPSSGTIKLILNRSHDFVSKLPDFTLGVDFDINGQDNNSVSIGLEADYYDTETKNDSIKTQLTSDENQLTQYPNEMYSYFSHFTNKQSDGKIAYIFYWNAAKIMRIRHLYLVPGHVSLRNPIQETRTAKIYSMNSDTKLSLSDDSKTLAKQLGLYFLPDGGLNDWFDKNLVQESQRANGKFVYSYPIYL